MNDHEQYLRMAVRAARLSPDTATRNGAVIVTMRGETISACNAPPQNIAPLPDRVNRPGKYTYLEHAERHAIYKAARSGMSTNGARLYCLWYACPHCARAIACAGIKEVVGLLALDVLTPARWREHVSIGKSILAEAGIRTRLYTEPLGMRVSFDGAELTV